MYVGVVEEGGGLGASAWPSSEDWSLLGGITMLLLLWGVGGARPLLPLCAGGCKKNGSWHVPLLSST